MELLKRSLTSTRCIVDSHKKNARTRYFSWLFYENVFSSMNNAAKRFSFFHILSKLIVVVIVVALFKPYIHKMIQTNKTTRELYFRVNSNKTKTEWRTKLSVIMVVFAKYFRRQMHTEYNIHSHISPSRMSKNFSSLEFSELYTWNWLKYLLRLFIMKIFL